MFVCMYMKSKIVNFNKMILFNNFKFVCSKCYIHLYIYTYYMKKKKY